MSDSVRLGDAPETSGRGDRQRSSAPRSLVAKIVAATPPGRDRAVDALRAIAILGVVLGHWLVTALVAPPGDDPALRVTSPLKEMPWLAPVSWALQTLAVFFFVGGYVGARAYKPGTAYGSWVRGRMVRLLRPVPVLLVVWVPVSAGLLAAGYDGQTLRSVIKLVLSPLWFLLVYAALTALTPLVIALWRRLGWTAVALAAAAVAATDLVRFAFDGPGWPGWANVLTGWLVPYLLGVAWAGGALDRRIAAGLLAGGAAAAAGLILVAGYPASMVGVPGAAVSNLNPPTLAAVAFGTAQVGAAVLLRDRLARLMDRSRWWAVVVVTNLAAMTIFLYHQTAMLAVTLAGRAFGVLPGLHTRPDEPFWAVERVPWLPVFAVALAVAVAAAHRFEHPRHAKAVKGHSR
ncbi:acyltransferase family protein [Thermomonospora cellulosilytica]|uniref:Peptidoglycan/LPS O-acetylase OafA/YrhL n=1 Tax=Thermomonospora cellulosilytica TaxID=1411118 RepID=A0A7W3R9A6_9ACTN|nr:acyltransferase [Thermomonospora cellulosilytica]MBA9004439.1 peptidoglycan/LPS O-acetylase OafA/YrhL [Thermomonospora cellulosilytica]